MNVFRKRANKEEKTVDPLDWTYSSTLDVQFIESSLGTKLTNENKLTLSKTEIREDCFQVNDDIIAISRSKLNRNKELGLNQMHISCTKDNVKVNASPVIVLAPQTMSDNGPIRVSKKLICKFCRKVYKDKAAYRFHMTQEEEIYFCHHCGNLQKITKKELIEHCKLHGIVRNEHFFRKAQAKNPRHPSQQRNFFCEICSTEFTLKMELNKHCEFEHKDHYKCEICSVGSNNLMDYIFHMQTHNENKAIKCPLCPFVTFKNFVITGHLAKVHEQFRKHKCNICGKTFRLYTHFEEHKKYFHTGEKPFQCDYCGKKFMYSRYLKSHVAFAHSNYPEDALKCPSCEQTFSSTGALSKHKRRKHSKFPHVCEVCGKVFKEREGLSTHAKIHAEVKQYMCSVCNRRFSRKDYLRQHERIHTGEKPHVCPHCGKKFTQRSSMVTHTRRHTGELPYGCQLCNKRFISANLLSKHRKNCKGFPVPEKKTSLKRFVG